MDEPLIFTSKGNVPIASLEYRHLREDVPGSVVFVEEYRLDDEVVKRAVHVLPVEGHMGGSFGNQLFAQAADLT